MTPRPLVATPRSDTFYDWLAKLEARLASLSGRDRWPSIEATTSSNNIPADLRSYDAFITFLAFSWTVQGKPNALILRAAIVRPRAMLLERKATIVQYHPTRPNRIYYAPRQFYARAVLAAGLVLFVLTCVELALYGVMHR